jgi:hypothetical protein
VAVAVILQVGDRRSQVMAGAARRCLAEHAEPEGAELWAGISLGGRDRGALGRAGRGSRLGCCAGKSCNPAGCRERKDQLLPFRQRAATEAGATRGAVARQSCSGNFMTAKLRSVHGRRRV